MATQANLTRWSQFTDWFRRNATSDIYCVSIGGALGGITWPLINAFLKADGIITPATFIIPLEAKTWMILAFFGFMSSGITVYVLSDTSRNCGKRLFFFSLIAGLTFPTILSEVTSGPQSEDKRLATASSQQKQSAQEAEETGDPTRILEAAQKQEAIATEAKIVSNSDGTREIIAANSERIAELAKGSADKASGGTRKKLELTAQSLKETAEVLKNQAANPDVVQQGT